MGFDICYFSGTGNSLAVARGIAERVNGRLVSIPAAVGQPRLDPQAGRIGIVFPAYMAHLFSVPLVVERFVRKLEGIGSRYLFAVCTCGGYESVNALPALESLAGIVRACGGTLSAAFSIRLPMNTLDYEHIPVPISQDQEAMFERCRKRLDALCRLVSEGRRSGHRRAKTLFNRLMSPLYRALSPAYLVALRKNAGVPEDSPLGFRELIPLTDARLHADAGCDGCSTCAAVCPVGNIGMVEGRPAWRHRCEMCLACAEWCPRRAIHTPWRADGKYYHHPAVTLADMMGQAR